MKTAPFFSRDFHIQTLSKKRCSSAKKLADQLKEARSKNINQLSQVERVYPSGVTEHRSFDAMGRLLTMGTSNLVSNGSFSMSYTYDKVGSALQMVQESSGLTDQAQDATTTWTYDDRYRLKSETVTVDGASSLVSSRTEYDWDNAGNRDAKRVYTMSGSTTSLVSTTTYTNNALNQITGWQLDPVGAGAITNVAYDYDANGSRTRKTESVNDANSFIAYGYDEDNRLVTVGIDQELDNPTHSFKYDYRSRRYYRGTPASDGSTDHMYCVFDGGLSIQEYDVPSATRLPLSAYLKTEFIRGEGMGGGVGGMVYSIKDGVITCSHANHRGDVIARSDSSRNLTSFALYEAYGTRPYEWGNDEDRQKANTKEEEIDLQLLNEGRRYRDIETGSFLSRDPIGYGDGPNVYCFVRCNPITKFDPLGLSANSGSKHDSQVIVDTLLSQISSHSFSVSDEGDITIDVAADPKTSETPKGDELVSRIINSPRVCNFELSESANRETDKSPEKATNGQGSDVTIAYNPNSNETMPTVDPETGCVTEQNRAPEIGGAHELIHGERSMRGEATPYGEKGHHIFKDKFGYTKVESAPKEELEEIGLVPVGEDDITENDIREEQDGDDRGAYDDTV